MSFCQMMPAPASLLLVAIVLAPGKDMATPGAAGVGPSDHSDEETGSPGAVCSVPILDGSGYGYSDAQVRDMVRDSEVVVRAVAADSVGQSYNRDYEYHFDLIRFESTEVLGGTLPDTEFNLEGFLVQRDEFNPGSVPYGHVRPSGSRGCFAHGYRLGAEYLFLLNRVDRMDGLTPYWIALGPTNEQIRGADDPWVRWVREQLAAP